MRKYLFAALAWGLITASALAQTVTPNTNVTSNSGGGGGGSGTVTNVSCSPVGGVACSVVDPTGAAVITVDTSGALTPSSVTTSTINGTPTIALTNATGTAASLTAGHATALSTGRTLAITGDLAYTSPSFDGSGNVTAAGTLATVNSNVGAFTNASVTVNAKGLVTAASSGAAGATLGANTFTDKQTITQGTANTGVLASTGYSLTGSNATNLLDLAGTLNTSGNPIGLKIAFTNTASGATTKFLSFLAGAGGATEVFNVNKAGIVAAGGTGVNFQVSANTGDAGYGMGTRSAGSHIVDIYNNSVVMMEMNAGLSVVFPGTIPVGFSATTADGVNSVALAYGGAAGVMEVNNGTKGSYPGAAFTLGPQTVAQLPTCNSTTKGARATATDATTTTFLGTLTGTGANIVPAFCNGTAWLIGEAANDALFPLSNFG